jgi:hypothetical protein
MPTFTLFYDYVDGMLDRRAPHRESHLDHLRAWRADGRIVQGGALGDPPTGGLIVFDIDDPAVAEQFAVADPYVTAGLVTSWRVMPWKLVD